jgi:hypothetical protein
MESPEINLLRSDDTDARTATVRRFGRSDRRAHGDRPTLRSIRPTRAALGVSRANIEAFVYRRSWKHLLSRRGGIGAEIGRWRTGTTGASETDRPTRIGTTGRVPGRSIGWRSRR